MIIAATQPDNDELSTVELGYKALSLFAVSVLYPRVSDLARLACDKLDLSLATSMRFRYFGTKELRSVPIFTRQTGISPGGTTSGMSGPGYQGLCGSYIFS